MSIAAFCVLYFTPGTDVRMASRFVKTMPMTERLYTATVIACAHGLFTIMKFFCKPLVYVFLLFLPLVTKKIPQAKIKLKVWHIVIITSLIAPFMQFLMGYGAAIGLPDRAVSLTLWCMFFMWCMLFSLFYRGRLTESEKFLNFARRWRYPLLVLALLISTNFCDAAGAMRIAPAYRAEYLARIQSIHEQNERGIDEPIVTRFENKPAFIYEDFGSGLVTGDVAKFFGTEKFFVIPKEFVDDPQAISELRAGNMFPLTKIAESDMRILDSIALTCDPMQHPNDKTLRGFEVSYEQAEKWNLLGVAHNNPQSMRSLSRLTYGQDKSLKGIFRALYWLSRYTVASLRI